MAHALSVGIATRSETDLRLLSKSTSCCPLSRLLEGKAASTSLQEQNYLLAQSKSSEEQQILESCSRYPCRRHCMWCLPSLHVQPPGTIETICKLIQNQTGQHRQQWQTTCLFPFQMAVLEKCIHTLSGCRDIGETMANGLGPGGTQG